MMLFIDGIHVAERTDDDTVYESPATGDGDTACGFVYTGACAPFAHDEDKAFACLGSPGPFKGFFDCLARPITNHGDSTLAPYAEVVTVFLENTEWDGAGGLVTDREEGR